MLGPLNPADIDGFELFGMLDEKAWVWFAASVSFWGFYHLAIEYEGLKCHMFAVHGLASTVLALLSLQGYCDDIVPLTLSAGYFAVHVLKALKKLDFPFVLHHSIALALMTFCVSCPRVFAFKCGSNVLLTEASTPLLFCGVARAARSGRQSASRS